MIENWVKVKSLGDGSYGSVTLWSNKLTGHKLAIKFPKESDTYKMREQWLQEIQIMKKLSHENLVKVYDVPDEMVQFALKHPILCMEYCTEGDLRMQLCKPEHCCGLPELTIRQLMRNVKDALQYLHSLNIIHRDLKPENITLQKAKDKIIYKLIDLGCGKEFDPSRLHTTFVGTLQYVAPEVFSQGYTMSVDYWSLGLICHEVITGIRPFLPHMAPFAWQPYVGKKSHDDICITQEIDGSIKYSSMLAEENHITQCLKDEFERWLKLALEWDGKVRGRGPDNKLILFANLDGLLDKKIITVFSAVTVEQLSYEVDQSTLFSTVMGWIERDTKHPAKDQLLLLPSGDLVDESILAHTCWDPNNEMAMAYCFSRQGLFVSVESPELPALVVQMLEEAKETLPYHIIRRMWAKSVYFIQNEIFLYSSLMESYAAKLLSILHKIQQMYLTIKSITAERQESFGQYKLLCAIVDQNREIYAKHSPSKAPENWACSLKSMEHYLASLETLINDSALQINKLRMEFDQVQTFCDSSLKNPTELNSLLMSSFLLYQSLQKMPKELRESETKSNEMVVVIYQALAVRHDLYTDKQLALDLENVNSCELAVDTFSPTLIELQSKVKGVGRELVRLNSTIFKDIWSLFPSKEEVVQNTPNGPHHSRISKEVEELIADNKNIRLAMENRVTEYALNCKTIIKQSAMLDADMEVQTTK